MITFQGTSVALIVKLGKLKGIIRIVSKLFVKTNSLYFKFNGLILVVLPVRLFFQTSFPGPENRGLLRINSLF